MTLDHGRQSDRWWYGDIVVDNPPRGDYRVVLSVRRPSRFMHAGGTWFTPQPATFTTAGLVGLGALDPVVFTAGLSAVEHLFDGAPREKGGGGEGGGKKGGGEGGGKKGGGKKGGGKKGGGDRGDAGGDGGNGGGGQNGGGKGDRDRKGHGGRDGNGNGGGKGDRDRKGRGDRDGHGGCRSLPRLGNRLCPPDHGGHGPGQQDRWSCTATKSRLTVTCTGGGALHFDIETPNKKRPASFTARLLVAGKPVDRVTWAEGR